MKIEKIEFNKIKVTLHTEDLKFFNINEYKLKNNSPELHIFLCEVMKRVRNETNFDPYDGRVVVEAMPSGEGLVLMVTKLKEEVHKIDKSKIKRVRAIKKKHEIKREIYKFETFDDFCKLLEICTYSIGKSSCLYELGRAYYLVTERITDARFSEFADICRSSMVNSAYLKEHGKILAEGEKLVKLSEFVSQNKKE